MDYKPILKFINRLKQSISMKQTDIRIPIDEANELSACLLEIMIDKKQPIIVTKQTPSNFDGGGFKT